MQDPLACAPHSSLPLLCRPCARVPLLSAPLLCLPRSPLPGSWLGGALQPSRVLRAAAICSSPRRRKRQPLNSHALAPPLRRTRALVLLVHWRLGAIALGGGWRKAASGGNARCRATGYQGLFEFLSRSRQALSPDHECEWRGESGRGLSKLKLSAPQGRLTQLSVLGCVAVLR